MSLIFPSSTFYRPHGTPFEISHHYLVLDVTLSGIRASLVLLLFVRLPYVEVLHYLTRTMKQVYAPHLRRVRFVHG